MKTTTREIACLLLLAPLTSLADTNDIKLGLSVDVAQTDNAKKKQATLERRIVERQEKYAADLAANYSNQWTNLKSNYNLREEVYEKNTQPDFHILEGNSELTFGEKYQPFSVLFSHSSMALLNSPDAISLSQNLVQRDIYGVEPKVKLRMGNADELEFKASVQEVSFGKDHNPASNQTASNETPVFERNKAQSKGGEIDWIRGISPVDEFQVIIQKQKTSFENHPESDYSYQNIVAVYSVNLSHLSYSLAVGSNRATKDFDNVSYSEPSYSISSSYKSGTNIFKFMAKQTISDSSRGNGNGQSLGDTSQSSVDNGSDLINLRDEELSWTTQAICERCSFVVSAVQHTKNYYRLPEDNKEKNISGTFRYKLTRASELSVRASRDAKSFEKWVNPSNPNLKPAYTDYTSKHINISYGYTFANDAVINFYVDKERRSSADYVRNYEENRVGLRLSYSF